MAPPTSFKKIPPTSSADVEEKLNNLWSHSINAIAAIEPGTTNWKQQVLPLARIKKIMKSDEAVYAEIERENTTNTAAASTDGTSPTPTLASTTNSRFMIASEAPILLGKACELLVKEITIRSWRHTERNRRRTLQKQDVHTAVGESEVYDFLIDIVPRVPLVGKSFVPPDAAAASAGGGGVPMGGVTINANTDVQSQATAALEQAMANQQVQETNAAQAQMQYNMMLQQHQQQMQAVEAAHAANNATGGAADGSGGVGVVNQQQMPQQMMMYMPQISWQPQAIPQQQQQQQQQQISAAPMVHNTQHHLKLQGIEPDLQKS